MPKESHLEWSSKTHHARAEEESQVLLQEGMSWQNCFIVRNLLLSGWFEPQLAYVGFELRCNLTCFFACLFGEEWGFLKTGIPKTFQHHNGLISDDTGVLVLPF